VIGRAIENATVTPGKPGAMWLVLAAGCDWLGHDGPDLKCKREAWPAHEKCAGSGRTGHLIIPANRRPHNVGSESCRGRASRKSMGLQLNA
jgi:hypothetical protein